MTDHGEQGRQEIEDARLDGFKRGLAKRDEQIRTGTLPHGIAPDQEAERGLREIVKRAWAVCEFDGRGELAEAMDALREALFKLDSESVQEPPDQGEAGGCLNGSY